MAEPTPSPDSRGIKKPEAARDDFFDTPRSERGAGPEKKAGMSRDELLGTSTRMERDAQRTAAGVANEAVNTARKYWNEMNDDERRAATENARNAAKQGQNFIRELRLIQDKYNAAVKQNETAKEANKRKLALFSDKKESDANIAKLRLQRIQSEYNQTMERFTNIDDNDPQKRVKELSYKYHQLSEKLLHAGVGDGPDGSGYKDTKADIMSAERYWTKQRKQNGALEKDYETILQWQKELGEVRTELLGAVHELHLESKLRQASMEANEIKEKSPALVKAYDWLGEQNLSKTRAKIDLNDKTGLIKGAAVVYNAALKQASLRNLSRAALLFGGAALAGSGLLAAAGAMGVGYGALSAMGAGTGAAKLINRLIGGREIKQNLEGKVKYISKEQQRAKIHEMVTLGEITQQEGAQRISQLEKRGMGRVLNRTMADFSALSDTDLALYEEQLIVSAQMRGEQVVQNQLIKDIAEERRFRTRVKAGEGSNLKVERVRKEHINPQDREAMAKSLEGALDALSAEEDGFMRDAIQDEGSRQRRARIYGGILGAVAGGTALYHAWEMSEQAVQTVQDTFQESMTSPMEMTPGTPGKWEERLVAVPTPIETPENMHPFALHELDKNIHYSATDSAVRFMQAHNIGHEEFDQKLQELRKMLDTQLIKQKIVPYPNIGSAPHALDAGVPKPPVELNAQTVIDVQTPQLSKATERLIDANRFAAEDLGKPTAMHFEARGGDLYVRIKDADGSVSTIVWPDHGQPHYELRDIKIGDVSTTPEPPKVSASQMAQELRALQKAQEAANAPLTARETSQLKYLLFGRKIKPELLNTLDYTGAQFDEWLAKVFDQEIPANVAEAKEWKENYDQSKAAIKGTLQLLEEGKLEPQVARRLLQYMEAQKNARPVDLGDLFAVGTGEMGQAQHAKYLRDLKKNLDYLFHEPTLPIPKNLEELPPLTSVEQAEAGVERAMAVGRGVIGIQNGTIDISHGGYWLNTEATKQLQENGSYTVTMGGENGLHLDFDRTSSGFQLTSVGGTVDQARFHGDSVLRNFRGGHEPALQQRAQVLESLIHAYEQMRGARFPTEYKIAVANRIKSELASIQQGYDSKVINWDNPTLKHLKPEYTPEEIVRRYDYAPEPPQKYDVEYVMRNEWIPGTQGSRSASEIARVVSEHVRARPANEVFSYTEKMPNGLLTTLHDASGQDGFFYADGTWHSLRSHIAGEKLTRENIYDDIFKRVAQEKNLPPQWLKAFAMEESGMNIVARPFNKDGTLASTARGLMQTLRGTAKHYGFNDYERLATDPEYSIRAGAAVLHDYYYNQVNHFFPGGNLYGYSREELAIAMYYRGPKGVADSVKAGNGIPDEWFTAKMASFLERYTYGEHAIVSTPPTEGQPFYVPQSIDVRTIDATKIAGDEAISTTASTPTTGPQAPSAAPQPTGAPRSETSVPKPPTPAAAPEKGMFESAWEKMASVFESEPAKLDASFALRPEQAKDILAGNRTTEIVFEDGMVVRFNAAGSNPSLQFETPSNGLGKQFLNPNFEQSPQFSALVEKATRQYSGGRVNETLQAMSPSERPAEVAQYVERAAVEKYHLQLIAKELAKDPKLANSPFAQLIQKRIEFNNKVWLQGLSPDVPAPAVAANEAAQVNATPASAAAQPEPTPVKPPTPSATAETAVPSSDVTLNNLNDSAVSSQQRLSDLHRLLKNGAIEKSGVRFALAPDGRVGVLPPDAKNWRVITSENIGAVGDVYDLYHSANGGKPDPQKLNELLKRLGYKETDLKSPA